MYNINSLNCRKSLFCQIPAEIMTVKAKKVRNQNVIVNLFNLKLQAVPRLFAVVSGKSQLFLWGPEGSESSSDHLLFPHFV